MFASESCNFLWLSGFDGLHVVPHVGPRKESFAFSVTSDAEMLGSAAHRRLPSSPRCSGSQDRLITLPLVSSKADLIKGQQLDCDSNRADLCNTIQSTLPPPPVNQIQTNSPSSTVSF